MPFITQGKTNWKFLLIIIILAVVVGVGALWLSIKQQVSPIQFSELKKSETADWKTYQSFPARFSIKCPSDFECSIGFDPLIDDGDYGRRDVILSNFSKRSPDWMKTDLIFISIASWTEFGSYRDINNFKDWVENNIEIIKSDNNSQLKQEYFILDNNPAIKLSFVNWPYENWIGRIIFVQKGKRIFEINASIDPEYQTTYLPIFDQMLSSIKFIEDFCGTSTNGSCVVDLGCIVGGCSGQVCQSKTEEGVITTCEYKYCYNAQSYGLVCKCVDKKCQWGK